MDKHLRWIPIDRPFPLPAEVREAGRRLKGAGYIVYLVGGSVRDFLLGYPTQDYDLVTSAKPEVLCALFPEASTVGKVFGVVRVPANQLTVNSTLSSVEIATFRKDLDYVDGRHPRAVVFSDPQEDALRRDFTINALFYDPDSQLIGDFVGGLKDLELRKVRCIGNPQLRFQEDALRLLRAVRFQSKLGFQLASETASAIQRHVHLLVHVSAERIRDEFTLMLQQPACALVTLQKLGLLRSVLPEVDALFEISELWTDLLQSLRWVSPGSFAFTWACVLHTIGKPQCWKQRQTWEGHEFFGSKLACLIAERLKFSRNQQKDLIFLMDHQERLRHASEMKESDLKRLMLDVRFQDLLRLYEVKLQGAGESLDTYAHGVWEDFKKKLPSRLITGSDLVALGLIPGPVFAKILREVEDLSLARKLTTKEEALAWVRKFHGSFF